MAVTKLMHMKEGKRKTDKSRHLQHAITYVRNPEKTQQLSLVRGYRVRTESAYEDMMATKRFFGKGDGRQGYHFVMAFAKGETDVETVTEIADAFISEYLKDYEVLLAVHDDKEHLHAHIIFNSISCVTRKKYHYKNGDWKKDIQPITDRLCREQGLSMILSDVFDKGMETTHVSYPEWKGRQLTIKARICKDLEAAIEETYTYPAFLAAMRSRGYEIRQGKWLAFQPPFDSRFYKGKRLGEAYAEEAIKRRLNEKKLPGSEKRNPSPRIREGSCQFQKRYKADIRLDKAVRSSQRRTIRRLMRQNTYLYEQNITSYGELEGKKAQVFEEWKDLLRKRKRIYRELKKPELTEEAKQLLMEQKKSLNEQIREKSRERYLISDIEKESIYYHRFKQTKEEQKEVDKSVRDR